MADKKKQMIMRTNNDFSKKDRMLNGLYCMFDGLIKVLSFGVCHGNYQFVHTMKLFKKDCAKFEKDHRVI